MLFSKLRLKLLSPSSSEQVIMKTYGLHVAMSAAAKNFLSYSPGGSQGFKCESLIVNFWKVSCGPDVPLQIPNQHLQIDLYTQPYQHFRGDAVSHLLAVLFGSLHTDQCIEVKVV